MTTVTFIRRIHSRVLCYHIMNNNNMKNVYALLYNMGYSKLINRLALNLGHLIVSDSFFVNMLKIQCAYNRLQRS